MKHTNLLLPLLLAIPLSIPLPLQAGDSGYGDGDQSAEDASANTSGNAIYKTTDSDGKVVFTDKLQPGEQGEKVYLGPVNVQSNIGAGQLPQRRLSPRDRSERTARARAAAGPIDFAIVSPQDGATIPPGQRLIALQVALNPVPPAGYLFYAVVDGQTWQGGSSGTSLDISALERGEHSVAALLTDTNGNVLAQSAPITIYVKRPGGQVPDFAAPRAKQAPKAPMAPGLPVRN